MPYIKYIAKISISPQLLPVNNTDAAIIKLLVYISLVVLEVDQASMRIKKY